MLSRVVAVALVALGAAVVTLTGTVHYTDADTRGTLLVSEQIIDNGTIALDAYDPAYLARHYNFYSKDGHTYDFFPVGTSVIAVPAVLGAKALGVDVFDKRANLEIGLAALIAAATVVALYLLARQFLGFGTSLVLAGAAWFGTTLASTGATALWSSDLAVLFAALALLLMVRMSTGLSLRAWPWLGIVLFLAWFCRPTMALLAPFVLGYLLIRSRRDAWRAAAVLGLLIAAFMVFSRATYGDWLPVYYRPGRLATETFGEALAGHLISPSRGLLVFTPVLVLIPLLALVTPSRVRERGGLLIVALGWPIAHWIVVSQHAQWYGGFSYGPRLMTDALPGLFLAIVLLWPATLRTWPSRVVVGLGAALAVFGIWIHTVQGLHNEQTLMWNVAPRVEDRPDKVWDWRYPQWLATPDREQERLNAWVNGATTP